MLHKAQSKVSRTIISSTVEVKSLQTKKTTLNLSRTFTSSLQVEEPNRKSKRPTEECQPSLCRKFRKASRNWSWPLTTPASSSAIPWKSSNSRTQEADLGTMPMGTRRRTKLIVFSQVSISIRTLFQGSHLLGQGYYPSINGDSHLQPHLVRHK